MEEAYLMHYCLRHELKCVWAIFNKKFVEVSLMPGRVEKVGIL
jgi:hypothetical protein